MSIQYDRIYIFEIKNYYAEMKKESKFTFNIVKHSKFI